MEPDLALDRLQAALEDAQDMVQVLVGTGLFELRTLRSMELRLAEVQSWHVKKLTGGCCGDR